MQRFLDLGPLSSDAPIRGRRSVAFTGIDSDGGVSYLAPRRVAFQAVQVPGSRPEDAYALWVRQGRKGERPKSIRYGESLSRRHLLGHLWRGRVLGLLGRAEDEALDPCRLPECADRLLGQSWSDRFPDFDLDHFPAFAALLASALLDRRCPARLADAVLGPASERPPPRWRTPDGLRKRLLLNRKDRWLAVGTGCEWLRLVVVDLDCKKEEDRPHLRDRLRFFTSGAAFPPPHLIVTSRGLLGRHLYWFTRDRSGGYDRSSRSLRWNNPCVDALTQALERAGVHVGPGTVEILPQRSGRMPPLPFGPRSHLCTPDGLEIEQRDPILSLLAWHRRGPAERVTVSDFRRRTAVAVPDSVLARIAKPAPSRQREEAREPPQQPGKKLERRHSKAAADEANRARDEAVWASGAVPGETYKHMPFVTRFIKHGLGGDTDPARTEPTSRDVERFEEWFFKGSYAQRTDGAGATLHRLTRQFRWLFENAAPYRPSRFITRPLTALEIRTAAELIAGAFNRAQPDAKWPLRSACRASERGLAGPRRHG